MHGEVVHGMRYLGGVYRVGNTGVIPGTQPSCSRRSPTQRSGPRKPCRGWSGWGWGPGVLGPAAGTALHPPLRGPVGLPREPSLVQDLSDCRLLAYRGEI